jgi:PD-(D/E)XK nuclease superfamily protein
MTDLHIRCSALPLAFTCPGSVRAPAAVPVNAQNDAADVGTAGHDGLARLVRTGEIDWDAVPELAKEHDVDVDELRVLLALGQKLWLKVRDSFPSATPELDLSHVIGRVRLTGHPDILGMSATTANIGDWKLGRLDSDYREQLRGYMALVLLKHEVLTRASACVLWVRDGDGEGYEMDRAGLYAWLQRVENEIVQWDGVFHPGTHCQYCPRSHECSAANALARRDFAIVADEDLAAQLEDTESLREAIRKEPEKFVRLLERADFAAKVAERVRSAIKEEVTRAGDLVGGGKRVKLQMSEKRHLQVWPAFPVLQEELGDEELATVINISIAKVEDVVRKKAGKGQGAAAVRALAAKLEEVGAVETRAIANLVVRREA